MSEGRNVYATILNPNNLWEMKVVNLQLSYPEEVLVHPPNGVFDLAHYLYSYYEKVSNKSCTNRLLEAFRLIQETLHCSYSDSVIRGLRIVFQRVSQNRKLKK